MCRLHKKKWIKAFTPRHTHRYKPIDELNVGQPLIIVTAYLKNLFPERQKHYIAAIYHFQTQNMQHKIKSFKRFE